MFTIAPENCYYWRVSVWKVINTLRFSSEAGSAGGGNASGNSTRDYELHFL